MAARIRALLDRLWNDYAMLNPQAEKIHAYLSARRETIVNDHIAFRTFDDPRVGIDALARAFVEAGYKSGASYTFPSKKLNARHFDPPDADLPKIFISELRLEECSGELARTARSLVAQMPGGFTRRHDFCVAGRPWKISHLACEALRPESEYAAWLAAFGFRANHFTVSVNALKTFKGVEDLNAFLKSHGFELNAEGGEIKGSPAVYLEQSSTRAASVSVEFTDGAFEIPGCYYEFARRYPMPDGKLFTGFVEKSADRIFESTNR